MSYAFQLSLLPFIIFTLEMCGSLVLEYSFIYKLRSNNSNSIHSYIHTASTDGLLPSMFALN